MATSPGCSFAIDVFRQNLIFPNLAGTRKTVSIVDALDLRSLEINRRGRIKARKEQ
jgi:hypothetical protein